MEYYIFFIFLFPGTYDSSMTTTEGDGGKKYTFFYFSLFYRYHFSY